MATFYAYACKTKNSSITNRPHKFDSLVKARKFAARWTLDGNTIVKIYRRVPLMSPEHGQDMIRRIGIMI